MEVIAPPLATRKISPLPFWDYGNLAPPAGSTVDIPTFNGLIVAITPYTGSSLDVTPPLSYVEEVTSSASSAKYSAPYVIHVTFHVESHSCKI